MIRTVLADDHDMVRRSVRALLERDQNIDIVAEARNGDEAVALIETLRPDVLIMDLSMPGMDGIEATQRVLALHPNTGIVILSMHADSTLVQQLLLRGVRSYLVKDTLTEHLLPAVHAVSSGERYLCPALLRYSPPPGGI